MKSPGAPSTARAGDSPPRRCHKRLDGVGVAIDAVPGRDEIARFREQQKQQPVDEGERVAETRRLRVGRRWPANCRSKCSHQRVERVEDAVAKRMRRR